MKRALIAVFGTFLALGAVQANAAMVLIDDFETGFAGPASHDGSPAFPTELYGFPGPDPVGISIERGANVESLTAGSETVAIGEVGNFSGCTGCVQFSTSNDSTAAAFNVFEFFTPGVGAGADFTQGLGGTSGSVRILLGDINASVDLLVELDDTVTGATSQFSQTLTAADAFSELIINLDDFTNVPGNDFTDIDFLGVNVAYAGGGGAPAGGLIFQIQEINNDSEFVPTPAALGLMLLALGGVAARRRRIV